MFIECIDANVNVYNVFEYISLFLLYASTSTRRRMVVVLLNSNCAVGVGYYIDRKIDKFIFL